MRKKTQCAARVRKIRRMQDKKCAIKVELFAVFAKFAIIIAGSKNGEIKQYFSALK